MSCRESHTYLNRPILLSMSGVEAFKHSNVVHTVFQESSAEVDFNEMLRLVDHPELQPDGFEELAKRMDADPSCFYLDPNAILYRYLYYKDLFFYQFTFLSLKIENELCSTETRNDLLSEVKRFKAQREWLMGKLEKDVETFLYLSDKRVRFRLYAELFDRIPDDTKFNVFMEVYTRGEYGFDRLDPDFIRKVFSYRELSEEHRFRDSFPDVKEYVTVYRGATEKSTPLNRTYSWTLKKDVAKYFANRWGSRGTVYKARVRADNIIAYYDGRNEEEVLVLPEHITALTKVKH
jgi:hypothetical protein